MHRGEILGIAGIEGNGQSELIEAITGMRRSTGKVRILGKDVTGHDPRRDPGRGLAHVPEDRLSTGVSAQADITDNLLVGKEKRPDSPFGFTSSAASIRDYAQEVSSRFDIRGARHRHPRGLPLRRQHAEGRGREGIQL